MPCCFEGWGSHQERLVRKHLVPGLKMWPSKGSNSYIVSTLSWYSLGYSWYIGLSSWQTRSQHCHVYTNSQKRMSHAHIVIKTSNWFHPTKFRSFPHFFSIQRTYGGCFVYTASKWGYGESLEHGTYFQKKCHVKLMWDSFLGVSVSRYTMASGVPGGYGLDRDKWFPNTDRIQVWGYYYTWVQELYIFT